MIWGHIMILVDGLLNNDFCQSPLRRVPSTSMVLAALLICLSGCHLDGKGRQIVVGLSINLSGSSGAPADDIRDGAVLAVKEINSKGGVKGRALRLIVRDDQNTREGVLKADRDLVNSGALVIVGHSYSQNTLTAYPLVTSAGRLLFTPYTATSSLSGKDDLFFRTSVDNRAYAKAFDRYFTSEGIRSASFLLDISNPSFSWDIFNQIDSLGKYRLRAVEYDHRSHDGLERSVESLLEDSPQAVVLVTEVKSTGIIAQKLRGAGFRGRIMGTLWAYGPRLFLFGGSAVEGMTLVTMLKPGYDSPKYRAFARSFLNEFGRAPNPKAARAYEAMWILRDAMAMVRGDLTPLAIKKALLAGYFKTIMGTVTFDRYGDVARPIYAITVKRGKFVVTRQLLPESS